MALPPSPPQNCTNESEEIAEYCESSALHSLKTADKTYFGKCGICSFCGFRHLLNQKGHPLGQPSCIQLSIVL
jgi:hypothetical protein